ncbi:hypothetical protein J2T55_000669 [Methylohalomonas lacus]|uniref:DUF2971 domain-containing protein n=1 Tax=Methylohalomonas lacus TaxID=398773 RepID=A0AAE3L0U8_9GAMM|nr:DUF2971 domain-containing protein [Methylohalomonas lacus]MCS3902665.1 hypothetical protein [Methylohalomonas lacus]
MFDEENVIYRYKYLPYTEGSIKTLTDSTIKFTNPLDFNDPFDCKPYYDTTNIDRLPQLKPDLFKAAGDRRGLSPAKRLQDKGKFIARLRNRLEDGSFAKESISRVGVVSLSKNALNILMWSHYADFHRGFVLEFRIPIKGLKKDVLLTNERLLPFPVIYQHERPHIDVGSELPDDLINKVVLTKSTDWKYEEEERVVDHERGPGIHHYRRDEILCSVIAGMEMSNDNYANLKSIVESLKEVNKNNLSIFKASDKKDEYKLNVTGHPRLHNSGIEKTLNNTLKRDRQKAATP